MWNFKNSVFLASIVICSSLIVGVFTENLPDCDIDKVHSEHSVILKITDENTPTYFSDFAAIPNEWICQNGKYSIKFVNDDGDLSHLAYNFQELLAPHSDMTAKELQLLALPRNLRRINASHNNIEHISVDTFPTPNNLHFLDLSFNNITELPTNAFQRLVETVQLSLANNCISNIPAGSFQTMDRLKQLDLSHNKINEFDRRAFPFFNQLEVLNLSHNNLSSMKFLESLHDLMRLNLAHNQIIEISALFSADLVELDLSSNQIGRLAGSVLLNSSKLEKLDLSGNQLSKLESDMFMGHLYQLKHLNLRQNVLSEIEFGTFSKLNSLEMLDVSQNRLTTFDLNMFPISKIAALSTVHYPTGFPTNANYNFKVLNIANNALVELLNFASDCMPNAVITGIDSNQFNCTHFEQIFDELTSKHLNTQKMVETCGLNDEQMDEAESDLSGAVSYQPLANGGYATPVSFASGSFVPSPFPPSGPVRPYYIPIGPNPIPFNQMPPVRPNPYQLNRMRGMPPSPFQTPFQQMPAIPPHLFPVNLNSIQSIHRGPGSISISRPIQ